MTLTVCLQDFIQHGFHVMVLNFAGMSHFTFIDCMFYNVQCSQSTATNTTWMYYLLYTLPIFNKWKYWTNFNSRFEYECMQIDFEFKFEKQSSRIRTFPSKQFQQCTTRFERWNLHASTDECCFFNLWPQVMEFARLKKIIKS